MTTPTPDISSLLDQLQEQLSEVIKERNELHEVLQLIQGFNWQLDDSPHGQEIKRRALELIDQKRRSE